MGRAKGKPNKGQPAGNRSASGRKRDRTPLRVPPCDGVLRRRAFVGVPANDTDTCDAIGRAYAAGLLGQGERAKDLLVAGRKIAWQYNRIHGFATPDSLARFQPSAGGLPMSPEKERIIEGVLNDSLATLKGLGHSHRRCFDTLVIDMHPDSGPPWLDRLIYAQRTGKVPSEADGNMMRLCLEGLEALA